MRKTKPSGRAIKSDRAKVVMTAGCIAKTQKVLYQLEIIDIGIVNFRNVS